MGKQYPQHPRPSCHALVYSQGKVLLIERGCEPLKGYWGLPGGSVELGETVAEALVREVQEETGLTVRVQRLLGFKDAISRDPDGRVRFHFVIFFFLTEPVSGTLQAADDAADAQWVAPENVWDYPIIDSVQQVLEWAGLWGHPSG